MKNSTLLPLILLLIILSTSGCATVRSSGYSDKYSQMEASEYLEKLYIDSSFNPRIYDVAVVILDKVHLGRSSMVSVDEMQNYLQSEMVYQLRSAHIFKEVTEEQGEIDANRKVLLCHFALTELNPGSRMARWMFGEFGAGHSKVQVEGKFVDANTKREMLTFADRRTGGAVLDITGGDPESLLREDIRNITKGVIKTLNRLPNK